MNIVFMALLTLSAVSLGLRTTAFLGARLHPLARLLGAIVIGGVLSAAFLEFCDRYRVFEFGLGLLLSLSPVGIFDLVKWWFLWRK
jgi:hypothetical protein